MTDGPRLEAVILEVWSERGGPPYVVRWHDGSRKIFFPASADTLIAGGPGPDG